MLIVFLPLCDLFGQVNQSLRYVHSCIELVILIKMSSDISLYINSQHSEHIYTLSQWFWNLLPNQPWAAELAEDSRATDFRPGLLLPQKMRNVFMISLVYHQYRLVNALPESWNYILNTYTKINTGQAKQTDLILMFAMSKY